MRRPRVLAALAVAAALVVSPLATSEASTPQTKPINTTKITSALHTFWDQARWVDAPGQTVPWICVDNHSSHPFQTATEQWDYRMNDGRLFYEDPVNCSTFNENETIDIFDGQWENGPCVWRSIAYNGNYYANMNIYVNYHSSVITSCVYTTIFNNHKSSVGVGIGLGAHEFNKNSMGLPDGVFVMDKANWGSVSWAQQPDGLNWDYRY